MISDQPDLRVIERLYESLRTAWRFMAVARDPGVFLCRFFLLDGEQEGEHSRRGGFLRQLHGGLAGRIAGPE